MSIAANASSSSDTRPIKQVDVAERLPVGTLPPLPTAYLAGEHHDLLSPLRFLAPGRLPDARPAAVDRTVLAEALRGANAGYGHPAAEALARKLADPATQVVVTGQQPGLYGGPLYALSKMVAAVRHADAIEAAGSPAVAVFWVATEDHDWAEMANATILGADGPVRLDLGDDPAPLTPVGIRTFGDGLTTVRETIQRLYPGLAGERWTQIDGWYRANARFGEAFPRLMIHLLGARAPLMLDAMDATVKRLQAPWLRRLVEARVALAREQTAADADVESRGLPLQVKPQPASSPLFALHGLERRRIVWPTPETYALRGVEGSEAPVAALLEAIDDNPIAISPGVLARPAIADALLGTTLQILGPGEMSYMAQAAATYRVLDLRAPWTALRPPALVLEQRQADQLETIGVTLEALLARPLDRLLAETLNSDIVTPVRARIDALLQELREPVLAVDPTLERPLRKTTDQIGRTLDQLVGKVAAATARNNEVWLKRLTRIKESCLPDGKPQERSLVVGHFMARYGRDVATAFLEQLALDPRYVSIIRV